MIDGATRAEWERGFGAILKKAEQVDAERRVIANQRGWANAWKWCDEYEPARPVEREVFRRIFWQCGNARRVADCLEGESFSTYKKARPGVDWEWLAYEADMAAAKAVQAPPKVSKDGLHVQLSLPFVVMSPPSIIKGMSRSPASVRGAL
jgi:hypothetical protein